MNIKILSTSYLGIKNYLVEVEIDISNGMPNFSIIGLGDTAIFESKERIKTSLKNTGYPFEPKKIVVNLSPASIKKEGAHFDLAIAIGILTSFGFLKDNHSIFSNYLILGELSLTGDIKPVKGIIGATLFAKEMLLKGIIIPYDNLDEAAFIKDIRIIPIKNILDLIDFIKSDFIENVMLKKLNKNIVSDLNLNEVKGQTLGKRALEIAAAGGHNLFLIGSPGSGKSMLAKRFSSILPNLDTPQSIECTKIYSILGELSKVDKIITTPPFRAPHHTASKSSILGGGHNIKPGEITLAHNGVLFLDEFSEFSNEIIESLRQPLEDKTISISRVNQKIIFPAKFILVIATNPCKCGLLFEDTGKCSCSYKEIERYQKKISGPIIDRMDLYVPIKKLDYKELFSTEISENSSIIKKRVIFARKIQYSRFNSHKLNSSMSSKEINLFCKLSTEDSLLLQNIVKNFSLSARSFDKILKISRTIADLAGKENIGRNELLEAASYRKY
ncbi:MAG: YifB family Mg chelatase-like AAA ATPase [Fusobacteriaceae bacterium]